jgi:hypothetical protein
MTFPAFLTGSAGRATYDLARVRGFGEAASEALHGIVDGSMNGIEAGAAIHEANGALLHGSWSDLVTASRPGLRRALGSGEQQASAQLHSAVDTLGEAQVFLAGGGTRASEQLRVARAGTRMADALVGTIDDAMPRLEAAARRTAITRLTLGTLGAGGAIAGWSALGDA